MENLSTTTQDPAGPVPEPESPIRCPKCGSHGPIRGWFSVRLEVSWDDGDFGYKETEGADLSAEGTDHDPEAVTCEACGHIGAWNDFVKEGS